MHCTPPRLLVSRQLTFGARNRDVDQSLIDIERITDVLRTYTYRTRADAEATRWAAVAMVFRVTENRVPDVLLIKRSEHPTDPWSGHMAMPGGRLEPTDASLRYAAERETREEVGLDLASYGQLLGRLDDVSAVARGRRLGLTIAPFVYLVREIPPLTLNHEVQEAVWIPLRDLAGSEYRATKLYEFAGSTIHLPCWNWQERIVWGLTYNMLETLLRLVKP